MLCLKVLWNWDHNLYMTLGTMCLRPLRVGTTFWSNYYMVCCALGGAMMKLRWPRPGLSKVSIMFLLWNHIIVSNYSTLLVISKIHCPSSLWNNITVSTQSTKYILVTQWHLLWNTMSPYPYPILITWFLITLLPSTL